MEWTFSIWSIAISKVPIPVIWRNTTVDSSIELYRFIDYCINRSESLICWMPLYNKNVIPSCWAWMTINVHTPPRENIGVGISRIMNPIVPIITLWSIIPWIIFVPVINPCIAVVKEKVVMMKDTVIIKFYYATTRVTTNFKTIISDCVPNYYVSISVISDSMAFIMENSISKDVVVTAFTNFNAYIS